MEVWRKIGECSRSGDQCPPMVPESQIVSVGIGKSRLQEELSEVRALTDSAYRARALSKD